MKRLLTVCILVSVLAVPAVATATTYLTLWSDEQHSGCSFFSAGIYIQFDVYVFIEPGLNEGFVGAEFQLFHPETILDEIDLTINPVFGLTGGVAPTSGIQVYSANCITEDTWICTSTFLTFSTEYCWITANARDETGKFVVRTCAEGNPEEPMHYPGIAFGYNTNGTCEIATDETTWGAIKSICR